MQPDESSVPRSRKDWLVCAALILITFALYWPVRHFEFNNYDDAQYLTQNSHVQNGLTADSIAWAFTTGYASNWHPLTWLSHCLDWQIFGANAGGHHLTGVFFHAFNSALLFLLLRQLTDAFWRCFFVAALFAWHPLHVESVAWVAERKDVLSAFFGLLSLIAYVRHTRAQTTPTIQFRSDYIYALLFFVLGLLSKPMLVSLPLILLLLDYWPLCRIAPPLGVPPSGGLFPHSPLRTPHSALNPLLLEKLPFFTLSFASCLITFLVQKHGQSVQTLNALPIRDRLANAILSYVRYVGKLFWPTNLAVLYPYPHQLPAMEITAAALFLLLASWLAWRARRNHPWGIVGWAWFVIMLVPVIGLVQVGAQSMADRYSYLPSIGLFIAVAWEFTNALGAGRARLLPSHPLAHPITILISTLALAACLIVSSHQIPYWKNGETLFSHAIAVTRDNAVAECDLGMALMAEGHKDEAITHMREALRIEPNNLDALNNLGTFLANEGKADEAEHYFKTALAVAAQNGQEFDRAHGNLGIIYLGKGRLDDAAAEFEIALQRDPENAHAQNGLGRVLEARGKIADATAHYAAAVKAKPDFADAHDNLGVALAAQGKFADAIEHFQTALKLQPDFTEAHYNFGNALAAQGHPAEAVTQYSEALRERPNYLEAHFNLALTLQQSGHAAEAIPHYRTALHLAQSTGQKDLAAQIQKRLDLSQASPP